MNSFKNYLIIAIVIFLTVGIADAAKKKAKPKKKSAAAVAEINAPIPAPAPAPIPEPNKPAPEPNVPAKVEQKEANQPDVTAIVVNGTKITEGQITTLLDTRMTQLANRIPPNMQDQYRQQMRKQIVKQMVIEEILAQKEKEKNIVISPAEVNEQINKQIAKDNLTIDDLKALLKQYGTTYSEFEQNMRKKVMFEKLVEGEFASKIQKPTNEQAKAFYDENIQQFSKPETMHARHILIQPEDSNDPNQAKAKAKAKAEDILKQLKGGADFNDLAKQFSTCSSAKNGGDLGEQPKGALVPEFEKAAYALKPGQMSDVVETQFGYHIIKLIGIADANTASFEQSKDKIVQYLTDKQKEEIVVSYIKQIKKESNTKFTNPADDFDLDVPQPAAAPARPSSSDKSEPNQPKSKVSPEADSKK